MKIFWIISFFINIFKKNFKKERTIVLDGINYCGSFAIIFSWHFFFHCYPQINLKFCLLERRKVSALFIREGGDIGLFIILVPKFYITIYIRLLNNFRGFYLIGWLIKLSVRTFQPLNAILCIIIGDVHQCIGYCLIPLDLWHSIWNCCSLFTGRFFDTRKCLQYKENLNFYRFEY